MQIFGYTFYALSLLYIFFLWHFPYDGVKRAVIQNFEEKLPLSLSIGRIGPSFPFHLHFEKLRIHSKALLFQLPDVAVQSNPVSFLWGKTDLHLKDLQSSQQLQGEIKSEKNQGRIKIRFNNLVVKVSSPNEFSFPLRLSGEATLQWVQDDFGKLNGQGWALLQRGEIQGIRGTQLPLPLSLFDTVRVEIQIQEGNLLLKRLVASGKDLKEIVLKDIQITGIEKGEFPDLTLFFQLSPK
ncbi:MAG: type II secretion system protein GspN [Thermodesulfobacteriota bacterium]|nr:type II secretion system protein GspN [Thermodesulfobacteriota bacterium]